MDQSVQQLGTLLKALNNYNFGEVNNILQKNPAIMSEDPKNNCLVNAVNASFAHKFTIVPPLSHDYHEHIKDLVHSGFSLDRCDQRGVPLLCNVIKYNQGDKYLDLLKGGAWVNIQDRDGKSPIVYAAELCDDEKISKLLLYGAAVNKSSYFHLPVNHPKRPLLLKLFMDQVCCLCCTHDGDLSNIPCINRHLGHFMCMRCYNIKHYCAQMKCPFCSRTLGKIGF